MREESEQKERELDLLFMLGCHSHSGTSYALGIRSDLKSYSNS